MHRDSNISFKVWLSNASRRVSMWFITSYFGLCNGTKSWTAIGFSRSKCDDDYKYAWNDMIIARANYSSKKSRLRINRCGPVVTLQEKSHGHFNGSLTPPRPVLRDQRLITKAWHHPNAPTYHFIGTNCCSSYLIDVMQYIRGTCVFAQSFWYRSDWARIMGTATSLANVSALPSSITYKTIYLYCFYYAYYGTDEENSSCSSLEFFQVAGGSSNVSNGSSDNNSISAGIY